MVKSGQKVTEGVIFKISTSFILNFESRCVVANFETTPNFPLTVTREMACKPRLLD